MNVNAIDELANYIEQRTDKPFDMVRHANCIMGFAAALWGIEGRAQDVGEKLGLNEEQANDLFFALNTDLTLDSLTRERAVSALHGLADTGQVIWQ